MNRTVWVPQARQREFLCRPEDEALYGGAAGGGKSEALVMEALRQVGIGHYRALILRGSYPQLTELIDKSLRYYPAVSRGARFNATSHTWTFPSGARIRFGSLHTAQDRVTCAWRPSCLGHRRDGHWTRSHVKCWLAGPMYSMVRMPFRHGTF